MLPSKQPAQNRRPMCGNSCAAWLNGDAEQLMPFPCWQSEVHTDIGQGLKAQARGITWPCFGESENEKSVTSFGRCPSSAGLALSPLPLECLKPLWPFCTTMEKPRHPKLDLVSGLPCLEMRSACPYHMSTAASPPPQSLLQSPWLKRPIFEYMMRPATWIGQGPSDARTWVGEL